MAIGSLAATAKAQETGQHPEITTEVASEPDPLAPPVGDSSGKQETSNNLPLIDLSLIRTEDFTLLYFDPAQTYLTPYVGRAIENSLRFHKKLFKWEPWEPTTVLLKDFSDYGNAAARSSPNNAVLLDVAPLGLSYETFSPGERFYTLSNHEVAHVATMDAWNSRDARWRKFFGGKPMPVEEHPETILYNFLATPRVNTPRWYLEGSAVFLETWMAGGLGRGQGAYDEMVWRAKARDDAVIYSPLALESKGTASDFQVGVNDYLYGTRFFSYLALTYGPAKVMEWLRRDEASAGFYETQFRRVFGKRLGEVWQEWSGWEREFQKGNLALLAQHPFTTPEHLTDRGMGSVSRVFVDPATNSLIGAFRYPGVLPYVGRLSLADGQTKKLADIKGSMLYSVTSFAYDPGSRTAFYTEDNYAYRDIIALNVDSGKRRKLLTDARIGDLAFNPKDKSLWGIRHQNGLSTFVRIPPPYAGFNQVYTFDYNENPFDLDISPDGNLISASVGLSNGKQSVRVWSVDQLMSGNPPETVAEFELAPSVPESFVFAPDGKSLYGSAYYTGVSNIFRYDLESGAVAAVSNASTGFFRPVPLADGSLVVFDFGGEGFIPSKIMPQERDSLGTVTFLGTEVIRKWPELQEYAAGSPAKIDLDSLVTERSKYFPDKERKLGARYPFVTGYKGDPAFGWRLTYEDPLQFKQWNIDLAVSPFSDIPDKERIHASVEFKTLNWRVKYWHNLASFYDLFGPLERSRKGDALTIGWRKSQVYDPPRTLDFFAEATGFVGLETLPNAQNVSGPKNLVSLQAGARYVNETKSLGSVDHEKGVAAELVVSGDYGNSDIFPRIEGGFSIGRPLPLRNSSIWLYTHAGTVGGPAADPLGSFYFGSFRNNYVDDREVKRYRELESFPGFEIDQIDARSFAKAIGEWNLPPVRFAEVGTTAFYLSSVRPAAFAGVLKARRADGSSETYGSVGGQLDLNFTVALRLPMTLSLGAARGIVDGNFRKTEWLISLKIL
ncbi:MAG: TolB family protein [Erythrobacter sp.]